MVGFPRLPLVHGETDDDASIHLHRQVGPAQPLRRNSKTSVDAQILEVVNDDSLDNLDTANINEYFTLYKQGKLAQQARDGGDESDESYAPGEDDSSTYNETEDEMSDDNLSDLNKFGVDEKPERTSIYLPEDSEAYNQVERVQYDNRDDELISKSYKQNTDPSPYVEREEYPYKSHGFEHSRSTSEREDRPLAYGYEKHPYTSNEFKPVPHELQIDSPPDSQTQTTTSSSSPEGEPEQKSSTYEELFLFLKYASVGLLITVAFITLFGREFFLPPSIINDIEYPGDVRQKLSKLSDLTESLSKRQDFLEANHEKLSKSFNSRFESLTGKFQDIQLKENKPFNDLVSEFDALKTIIQTSSLPVDEAKLDAINNKLAKFDSLEANFESVKSNILSELTRSLPDHIPVYYKNNKIHFVPDFHKFLYSFIDNYDNRHARNGTHGVEWEDFLRENKQKLDTYLDGRKVLSAGPSGNVKYLNRENFDRILKLRFDENNKYVFGKINDLIDKLNFSEYNSTLVNTKFNKASSDILLSNLLEVFSKGAVKVNYADYNLGSRILGFLTKLSLNPEGESINKKSIARRLFLGWYDYLSKKENDGGLLIKCPSKWKYNANNALLDNELGWQCESNSCSIGVRLFNSIVLTDVVIKTRINDESDNANAISPPQLVAIYVKPKRKEEQIRLREHLARYRLQSDDAITNKYLTKFVKIKEFRSNASQRIIHLKIPVSIVNLRISIQDIYVELRSPRNTVTGINNFRVYGITELNTYKYNEEFDTLLDKLSQIEGTQDVGGASSGFEVEHEPSPEEENSDQWGELLLEDDELL